MSTMTQAEIAYEESSFTLTDYNTLKDAINNFCEFYNDTYQFHGLKIKNKKLIYLMLKQFEQDIELIQIRYNNTTEEDIKKQDDDIDCMDIELSFIDIERNIKRLKNKLMKKD
jgi:hypothetical protein